MPLLLFSSFLIWLFAYRANKYRYMLIVAISGAAFGVIYFLNWIGFAVHASDLKFNDVVFGTIRMLLSPRPWGIDREYSYLVIPSFMHWLFLIPAIWGAMALCRHSRNAGLIVIFAIVVLAMYGASPMLQGVRQRYQLSFLFCWAQFHWIWVMIKRIDPRSV